MIRPRRLYASILLLALLLLTPALAQDTRDLSFSSDARFLAQLDANGTLYYWDLHPDAIQAKILSDQARGKKIAWHPKEPWLAFTRHTRRGWQCVVIDIITNETIASTNETDHCMSPAWRDEDTLLFIKSTTRDPADIWSLDINNGRTRPSLSLNHAQWGLSNSGNKKAPVLYISNNEATEEVQFLKRFGRHETLGALGQGYLFQNIPRPRWDKTGQWATYVDAPTTDGNKRVIGVPRKLSGPAVWYSTEDIASQVYCPASNHLYVQDSEGMLVIKIERIDNPEARREKWRGLTLSHTALGPEEQIAVIVDNESPAIRYKKGQEFKLLLTDWHTHIRLAERLCLNDDWQGAEQIYQTLLATIQAPLIRSDIHLHRLAWMRKTRPLSETKKNIRSLSETEPPVVDALRLAFEKTFFQLFEEKQAAKAQLQLQQLVKVSEHPPRVANEALVILSTRSGKLLDQYIKARAALRREDFKDAMEQYTQLADIAPSDPLVIEAVLSAIADPFGYESLTDRKNPFTEGYLSEDLLALLNRLDARAAPVALLQERMYMQLRLRDYEAVRHSARAIVERQGIEGLGVKDFLRYFIESERSEWSAQDLMGKVLLETSFRNELTASRPQDLELRTLFDVAAAKVALLEGERQAMEDALVSAQKDFEQSKTHTPETLRLQTYIWLYAARHHERLKQWNDAEEDYNRAIKYLWQYAPRDIEMDIMLRASRAEAKMAANGEKPTQDAVWQMQMILRGMGDPLVNPTRHPERLREAARQLQNMLHATPKNNPLANNLRLHLGVAMMRLDLPMRAEKPLTEALQNKPDPATRAALLLTMAQCDELREDYNRAAASWLKIEKSTLHQGGYDALRQLRAQALENIARNAEAAKIWQDIEAHAITESSRQDAAQHLDGLDQQ